MYTLQEMKNREDSICKAFALGLERDLFDDEEAGLILDMISKIAENAGFIEGYRDAISDFGLKPGMEIIPIINVTTAYITGIERKLKEKGLL